MGNMHVLPLADEPSVAELLGGSLSIWRSLRTSTLPAEERLRMLRLARSHARRADALMELEELLLDAA